MKTRKRVNIVLVPSLVTSTEI